MSHLPPVGWGDVARRSDIDQLEARLVSRSDSALHRELGQLRADMLSSHRQLRGMCPRDRPGDDAGDARDLP